MNISCLIKLSSFDVLMLIGDFNLDFTIVGLLGLWPTSFYMRCKYLCILSSGVREEVDIIVKR